MSELKSCPFCGEMPELFTNPCYYYQCVKSGCEGQEVSWNDTEEEALKSWNARPIEDALRAEIEELKKDKPILCAECNDHILPDDEAICGVCANTKKSIITELMEENETLKAKAIVWHKYPDEKPVNGRFYATKMKYSKDVEAHFWRGGGEYWADMLYDERADDIIIKKLDDSDITHWAYLPEPPKEEKC